MNGKEKAKYLWGNPVRYIYSFKNRRHIWLNGTFEKDVALHYEFNDHIIRYQEQPISLRYYDLEGELRRYTTDFLCHTFDRLEPHQFIEAKKKEFTYATDFKVLMRCARKHLRNKHKRPLKVVTEEDIVSPQCLTNYKRFYHYKRVPSEKFLSLTKLRNWTGDTLCLYDLRDCLRLRGFQESIAYSLIAHLHVRVDFNQPINDESWIEVA